MGVVAVMLLSVVAFKHSDVNIDISLFYLYVLMELLSALTGISADLTHYHSLLVHSHTHTQEAAIMFDACDLSRQRNT